ncbi:hypothetical protein D9757_003778 [Collybiopsis confluens]|uniref:Aquaporin-like protein n=1 Tax=Collybiopsis confluens TaxID=2823264 RepID=A0A8H5HVJ5_9AGAR|nr:hypothetical protein D9757_003778 [Collybiopsis confluens]
MGPVTMSTPVPLHLSDVQTRPRIFTVWERYRHSSAHWLVECFAEFLGVFFYVYPAILQVGLGYAGGIVFALGICSSTSGGHFNPAVTITFVILKGFPPLKAVRYIIAQILGSYVACLLIYAQWHDIIKESEVALDSVGMLESTLFTPNGPAGAFGLYILPGLNLGRVFLNEFVTDTFLAIVIWGTLDPTNILIPPQSAIWVIAVAYGAAVWGFSVPALAANPARDVGGRLAALTIYGKSAAGNNYSSIAALTSIPATLFGALVYQVFLADYARVIPSAQREFMDVHHQHAQKSEIMKSSSESSSSKDKAEIMHNEDVAV